MRLPAALGLALLALAQASPDLSRREEEFLAEKRYIKGLLSRREAKAEPCGAEPCGDHMDCVDTKGTKECRCKAGFRQDGDVCADVDECALFNPCSDHEKCVNLHGSFRCECEKGDTFDKVEQVCVGRSEAEKEPCGAEPCGDHMDCVDTKGTKECRCKAGYRLEGEVCADINECTTNKKEYQHKCGQNSRCRNTEGSYRCYCLQGYKMNLENQCEDIDECANVDPCVENEECVNLQGSFRCECAKGYRMDPVAGVCFDIDECTEEPKPCLENERCDNRNGSYVCECSWQDGFKKAKNGACKRLCLEGYKMFGEQCYKMVKQKATFASAKKRCEKDGGNLTEPRDERQSEYLYQLLEGQGGPAWLGVTTDAKGIFTLVSNGLPLEGPHDPWTHWAPNQPDAKYKAGRGELAGCVEMRGPDAKSKTEQVTPGQWWAVGCDEEKYSICQRDFQNINI